ncbi:MAG: Flp pilus assembly complex ATPase component TadA [Candidatus Omnitrophica bacterium]|nr:Flp pilus assembly complex ATPase component TadA [Candidatus Omnitrophota bacterium]
MKNLNDRLLEILKASGQISGKDAEGVLEEHGKNPGEKIRNILIRKGLVAEKELISILGAELKIPFLNLSKYKIDPEVIRLVSEKLARAHQAVPVSRIGGKLTIAIADPLNIVAIDDIALHTGTRVDCVISTEKDIQEALDRFYPRAGEDMTALASAAASDATEELSVIKSEEDSDVTRVTGTGSEAPVVKLVDLLILEALRKRASDIHIEPFEKKVRVRYRVDGHLTEAFEIPRKNQNAVLTRLKIMSRLDITENRVPQDGRFKIRLHDKEVDFRVSVLPVYFGNKVVMRILDKSALSFGLDHLGFLPETLEAFKAAVTKPFGMILITGPTGSGKSTTLYSILSQLNTPEKNIITIEDPIEYQIEGITQIHARPEVGLDFANGLRAILRQSPDIVMVGEIRDAETADIAIKAALTGQLVLSTLHTNDAAGAMTRLVDMRVEPFLIASSVILVAAQRLCRKICDRCKEKVGIPKEVFERLGVSLEKIVPDAKERNFFRGKGCDHCGRTGYRGRMGVLETIVIDDAIRDLVIKRASAFEIKNYALEKGMTTLREDALKKCCQGLTTLDEVIRVTMEDE